MDFQHIQAQLASLRGKVGFFYEDLESGDTWGVHADEPYIAASVIKLLVLCEAYRQFEQGILSKGELIPVRREDRVPSCGAAAYLHDGISLTLKDLCVLMIILSDNTATNLLIRKLGMDNINRGARELGFQKTRLNRLLFDAGASAAGIENYFAPSEIGRFYELLWRGELVSADASREMLEILKNQEINHKIPSMLPEDLPVAHKTGEDSGITHDTGIIYAPRPFILCFASNDTDVPETEQFIRTAAREVYDRQIDSALPPKGSGGKISGGK